MNPSFEQVYPVLYQGWREPEARADYNAGGWRNKAGAEQFSGTGLLDPESRANQAILTPFQDLTREANKRVTESMAKNPFRLDEILAQKRTQATEQLDPYYNEKLSDYITGVQRKITRSTQDTQDLLGELRATTESYTGTTKLRLTEAISRAAEGKAEAGLYESGGRLREQGLLETEAGTQLSDFERRQALREKGLQTGLTRLGEDYGLGQFSLGQPQQQVPGLLARGDIRDIYRQRGSEIDTLASRLTKEQGQRYSTGIYASLPPEYQANANFDILKQIGIY